MKKWWQRIKDWWVALVKKIRAEIASYRDGGQGGASCGA